MVSHLEWPDAPRRSAQPDVRDARAPPGALPAGGEVTRNKPAPDIYLLGLSKLGLAAADCVVVEDSVNGIRAGRAAGMLTIGIASTFDPEELKRQAQPDFVLTNVCELASLLQLAN